MKKWPEGTQLTVNEKSADWSIVAKREADNSREYLCSAAFPAPDEAGIRPLYITGRGWVKSTWFASGYGPTALEAEDAAWENYNKIITCQHNLDRDVDRIAHVDLPDDQPKVYLLDGDAICNKCQLYLPFYYMDNRLHQSMNLAHRGHEHQKRKYGDRPYIVHPRQVYTKTAFWKPKRPEEERIVMGCAAWMHDLKEDCQSKDSNPFISDDEIRAAGDQAFQLVFWLTNPSKGVKKPRAYRKQMDREHIAIAPHPAKIIKMFDRICNLNDLYECKEMDFLALYASESRLLWDVLKDADEKLARDMLAVIEQVERRAQDGINTRSSQDPQNLPQD